MQAPHLYQYTSTLPLPHLSSAPALPESAPAASITRSRSPSSSLRAIAVHHVVPHTSPPPCRTDESCTALRRSASNPLHEHLHLIHPSNSHHLNPDPFSKSLNVSDLLHNLPSPLPSPITLSSLSSLPSPFSVDDFLCAPPLSLPASPSRPFPELESLKRDEETGEEKKEEERNEGKEMEGGLRTTSEESQGNPKGSGGETNKGDEDERKEIDIIKKYNSDITNKNWSRMLRMRRQSNQLRRRAAETGYLQVDGDGEKVERKEKEKNIEENDASRTRIERQERINEQKGARRHRHEREIYLTQITDDADPSRDPSAAEKLWIQVNYTANQKKHDPHQNRPFGPDAK